MLAVGLCQGVKLRVAGVLGRERVRLHPAAGGILEEVRAGLRREVHVFLVNARLQVALRGGRHGSRHRHGHHHSFKCHNYIKIDLWSAFIVQNYNEKAIHSRHRADLLADNANYHANSFSFQQDIFSFLPDNFSFPIRQFLLQSL